MSHIMCVFRFCFSGIILMLYFVYVWMYGCMDAWMYEWRIFFKNKSMKQVLSPVWFVNECSCWFVELLASGREAVVLNFSPVSSLKAVEDNGLKRMGQYSVPNFEPDPHPHPLTLPLLVYMRNCRDIINNSCNSFDFPSKFPTESA